MKINTNIPALSTYNSLTKNNKLQDKVMKRMSTGFRINSVADDAAGMAISTKMRTQISGLKIANRNTMDGISLVQTADACLSEIQNMVQRCRELAVQATNGSLDSSDRDRIQYEIDDLLKEINDAAEKAEFNKIKILNGTAGHITSCSKLAYGNVLSVSNNVDPGDYTFDVVSVGMPAIFETVANTKYPMAAIDFEKSAGLKGVIYLNGERLEIEESDTGAKIFQKLSELCERSGMTIERDDDWGNGVADGTLRISTNQAGSNQHINLTGSKSLLYGIGLAYTIDSDYVAPDPLPDEYDPVWDAPVSNLKGTDAVIKNLEFTPKDGTVPNVSLTSSVLIIGNRITISDINDKKLVIDLNVKKPVDNSFATNSYYIGNKDAIGVNKGIEVNPNGTLVGGDLEKLRFNVIEGGLKLQVGPNTNMEINLIIQDFSSYGLGIDNSSVRTVERGSLAITEFDDAVSMISAVRAKLGAYQNRMEFTSSSLDATETNTSTALSRIIDTNMALESSEYAKYSVLVQAGISVMGQANMRPQQIISLLQ